MFCNCRPAVGESNADDAMCAVYDRLGIHWATSLLGFISVAMLPIPWVLFKWGPRIRARSRYDTVDA